MNKKHTQSIAYSMFLLAFVCISNSAGIPPHSNNQAIKFEKISELPVSVSITDPWSAKVGDSIFYRDSSSNDGMFAVINVQNPESPKLEGYVDSTALLAYPAETLIPFYLQNGVYSCYKSNKIAKCGDLFLFMETPIRSHCRLKLFKMDNNDLVIIDSQVVTLYDTTVIPPVETRGPSLLQLGDSIIVFQYILSQSGTLTDQYCLPIHLSSTKINLHPVIWLGRIVVHPTMHYSLNGTINGYSNTDLIISVTEFSYSSPQSLKTINYNFSTNQLATNQFSGESIRQATCSNGFSNTGIIFSPGIYLYSTSKCFFAGSAEDIFGYATTLANNSVYCDSSKSGLANIFCDTVTKKVFLLYEKSFVTLNYAPSKIINNIFSNNTVTPISITNRNLSEVKIELCNPGKNSDLFFFDLNGRMIDKILHIATNSVIYNPKSHGCNIVKARIGKNWYRERFVVK